MSESRSIVVITGMSGAGRTTALRVLEDLGYFCIDNLPTPLLAQSVALCSEQGGRLRVGIGMDVRVRAFLDEADVEIGRLKGSGATVTVIFLDADDSVLVRRYSESRRPHPLTTEIPGADLLSLIRAERERLLDLRGRADRVIDTSDLNAHEFRRFLVDVYAIAGAAQMTTRVMSFGFKYGIPIEADLMFDLRYLPNPHFVPALRPRTGLDADVAAYVMNHPESREMVDELERLLVPLLPRYAKEGKVILTVAVGCTGGR
ncbi:MAG: RNase adapter RapZ, partial [Deltaproteobacteria bacterium]